MPGGEDDVVGKEGLLVHPDLLLLRGRSLDLAKISVVSPENGRTEHACLDESMDANRCGQDAASFSC